MILKVYINIYNKNLSLRTELNKINSASRKHKQEEGDIDSHIYTYMGYSLLSLFAIFASHDFLHKENYTNIIDDKFPIIICTAFLLFALNLFSNDFRFRDALTKTFETILILFVPYFCYLVLPYAFISGIRLLPKRINLNNPDNFHKNKIEESIAANERKLEIMIPDLVKDRVSLQYIEQAPNHDFYLSLKKKIRKYLLDNKKDIMLEEYIRNNVDNYNIYND